MKHGKPVKHESMPSICHINLARNPKLRGGERQTEILIQTLAEQGVLKQYIVVLRKGPLARRFKECHNLKVFKVRNRLSALFICLALNNKTLLHAHETHAAQVAYVASLCRKTYIVTRRVINPIKPKAFTCAMYRNAHTVVALTRAVENSIRSRLPDISIVRIPSAWNPGSPDMKAVKKIRDQFKGEFLIGYAGAMDGPEKGHLILLESARIIQPAFPKIKFVLLGSGLLEEEFRRQSKDLSNVYFAGWVSDPITWIAAFDIFAFPSLREGLGSVLLDVLRAGCPIVASHVGGVPEVITKDCGILVPPKDAKALTEQLVHLYQTSSLRTQLKTAGIARSFHFSPELMAQRYMEVYMSIFKSPA
ncbi:MAG: glycosyltransferase family 4 protein [Gammaproteobacteria bacterium]|nr:glycosyltransferase family 4 protein [Gammaproteobacteria bacterium]